MQISDLSTAARLTVERTQSQALASLRPGQTLQATVSQTTRDNQVGLRIGNVALQASTNIQLNQGEKLTLRVIRAPDPLELQLVQERPAGSLTLGTALRQALPHQLPLDRVAAKLAELVPGPPQPPTAGAGEALSSRPTADTPLLQQVRQLFSELTAGTNDLNAGRLRQAFDNSGLFLEARLAAGKVPATDLKVALLRLLVQLRTSARTAPQETATESKPATSPETDGGRLARELLPQIEGSLSRLLLNQLASVPGNDNVQQLWRFELPLRSEDGVDQLQLQINREQPRNGQKGETRWSVDLHFDLAELGPIHSRLNLQGKEISSYFTVARPATARRLEQALPQLSDAFSRAGLQVGRISMREGEVAAPEPTATIRAPLLDEKA